MGIGIIFLASWILIACAGLLAKRSAIISVGGGFIAALVIFMIYVTVINPKADFELSNLPDGAIYAKDLYSEYDGNEVAADLKYKDKIICVYGKVMSIDTLMGYAFVTLKGKLLGTKGVQCSFGAKEYSAIASLKKGQPVVLEGKCSGKSIMAGVQLSNCRIIQ